MLYCLPHQMHEPVNVDRLREQSDAYTRDANSEVSKVDIVF